ncbi:hypothetical protein V500_04666 [Pseudogymnoascus sp. VKM F-4518 (FW-2643)]|nr:hypothetical protein V500_04666 [Pseudogymnoascus sp. VKM F-4518 (FW-2643)]
MDPLSICASIIALCQAVTAITAGIREIATVIAAPDEISDLHNELETVHGYLDKTRAVLESLASSESALPAPDLSHVHSVVKSLEGELGELARMVEVIVRQMQGADSRRRKVLPALKWRHRRRDITRRRDKIRQLRTALAEAVMLLQPDQSLQQAALVLEVKEVSELGFDEINKLLDQATISFQEAIDKISQQVTRVAATSQMNISVRQHTESSVAVLQVLQEASEANHGVRSRLESINPTTNVPGHLEDPKPSEITSRDVGIHTSILNEVRLILQEHEYDAARLQEAVDQLSIQKSPRLFSAAVSSPTTAQSNLGFGPVINPLNVGEEISPRERTKHDNRMTTMSRNREETLLQVQATLSRLCPKTCRCDCHKINKLKTPGLVSSIVGQFLWIVGRAVSFSISWASGLASQGAAMYLKIPRVIPESHDVWTAISNNNISRLQYLFAQKEILSTDISQRGESLFLAALRYYKCWPTARFLIDFPHDSIHLDDTGSSPHAMAKWRLVVDEKHLHDDAAYIYRRIINQSEEYSHTTVLHDAVLEYQNMALIAALELDPSSINTVDDCGCTPLHWAAWKNDIDAVRLLLSWKADLDLRDFEGRTALSIAVAATKLQCAQVLIEAGADVNAKDKWNWTPLFLATREQSVEMVKLLLSNGANPQAMDDDRDTALSSPIYAPSVVENSVLVKMYAELANAGANTGEPQS